VFPFLGRGIISRDLHQLARACQILVRLGGFEGQPQWTDRGPTRRASWLKGYLRRAPRGGVSPSNERVASPWRGPIPAEQNLSHREKTVLLVAFDFWNGSGDVGFSEVLGLPPRLVTAISALMAAHCADTSEALAEWIDRWSPDARH
jgi:hypothetical protein